MTVLKKEYEPIFLFLHLVEIDEDYVVIVRPKVSCFIFGCRCVMAFYFSFDSKEVKKQNNLFNLNNATFLQTPLR